MIKKFEDFSNINESVTGNTDVKISFSVPADAFNMIVQSAEKLDKNDTLYEVGELQLVTEVMEQFIYSLIGGSTQFYMDEFYTWFKNEGDDYVEEALENLSEE